MIITNLDNSEDFRKAITEAVQLGAFHVAHGQRRVKSDKVVTIIAARLGKFSYRRFHQRLLNSAYGLSFINQKKMNWVRKQSLNAAQPTTVESP